MSESSSEPASPANDIVHTCAFQGLAVIRFQRNEHARISSSISSTFRAPVKSLGTLKRLPLELINEICLDLNLSSLFRFRQVNLRARQVVNSLPEYKIITAHALDTMGALLRTGASHWVTLTDFYRLLCQPTCAICQTKHGDLVHLIHFTRLCYTCLDRRHLETRTTTLPLARHLLHLSYPSCEKLRQIKNLPGTSSYSRRKDRGHLVSIQDAFRLRVKGRTELDKAILKKLGKESVLDIMACCGIPYYDEESKEVKRGGPCIACRLDRELEAEDEAAAAPRPNVYQVYSLPPLQ